MAKRVKCYNMPRMQQFIHMRKKFRQYIVVIISLFIFLALLPAAVSAHEVYVLKPDQIANGFERFGPSPFDALQDPNNVRVFGITVAIIIAVLIGAIFFERSRYGARVRAWFEQFAPFGNPIVRITVALALFFSAMTGSFLGPEVALIIFPFGPVIQILLGLISGLLLVGLFTEIAAFVALVIFGVAVFTYRAYMLTYMSYIGVFLVLLLVGSRVWSLDGIIRSKNRLREKFEKYRTLILRVFFGGAFIYAAIIVKFMHATLPLNVVYDYKLNQLTYLFPTDPLLIVLGAGLAEIAIGLFIIFGFQLRLTLLVTLFYLTLSLIYFREVAWPHLIFYGLAIILLVEPERYALDNLLRFKRKEKAGEV